MDNIQKTFCKITVFLRTSLAKDFFDQLAKMGIYRVYYSFSRCAYQSQANFLTRLIGSHIEVDSFETIFFYVTEDDEEKVMKSIAELCQFDITGRGSIISREVSFNKSIDHLINQVQVEQKSSIALFENLTQTFCTTARGQNNELCEVALNHGIVPTILSASGTGLRDQIGLLRITIPKEKEILTVVSGAEEAPSIFEHMIYDGRLNRPGRGFIWQTPLHKGIVHLKPSQDPISHAAALEQMIAAIDSLKGNIHWRRSQQKIKKQKNTRYFSGYEYIVHAEEQDCSLITKALNSIGISGATIQPSKLLNLESDDIVPAHQLLRIVISEDQNQDFLKLIQNTPIDESCYLCCAKVTRAFNFIPARKN